jgi:glycosyltransferase involved in cell wall biosynthesis
MRQEKEVRSILVSHILPIGTAAMIARGLGGRSYGVFFHGMDLLQGARSKWKTWLVKQIVRNAQALFVNSEVTASILRLFSDRVPIVLTPAVESRTFLSKEEARKKLGISLEERIVLAVGRLVPRKGFDVLIEAMKSIDARLVIIGDGTDRERLVPTTYYLLPTHYYLRRTT